MLTPQEISEKGFVKAVFGGYDMEGVDDFLETVSNDYGALYKENAILKGKLKVLVEKVEEYRSTEDAMRMALLTAQRMGEEITVEAKRTKDEMLQNTENEIKTKLSDSAARLAEEETRLALATKETAKFIELSQAIMRKHAEFLDKLESARRTVKPAAGTKQVAAEPAASKPAARPVRQTQPARATASGGVKSSPPPSVSARQPTQPLPQPAPAQPTSGHGFEIDDIADQIGSIVGQMTDNDAPSSQSETISASSVPSARKAPALHVSEPITFDEPPASLFDDDELPKLYTPEDELENTSPRPKFDFDDLKFGANFDSDD